jgi:hypothetical protein
MFTIHPIVMGTKIFDKSMMKIRDSADILLPLHEPVFASRDTIPAP